MGFGFKGSKFRRMLQDYIVREEILPWVVEMMRSQYMEKHLLIRVFS